MLIDFFISLIKNYFLIFPVYNPSIERNSLIVLLDDFVKLPPAFLRMIKNKSHILLHRSIRYHYKLRSVFLGSNPFCEF